MKSFPRCNGCVLFSLLLLSVFYPAFLQAESKPVKGAESEVVALNDGPYIFWEKNHALVLYVADGEVFRKTIDIRGKSQITVEIKELKFNQTLRVAPPVVEQDEYRRVKDLFVVSDLHGQYDSLIRLLSSNKIVDRNLNWKWGRGHLVVVGDVMDRGPRVTEIFWLLRKLEAQALKAGGKVHLTLGNHEVMIMQGDSRYVNPKYEEIGERHFKMEQSTLYGPNTEIGRWLRTRHTMLKINDILFVHGGIHPYLMAKHYTISSINAIIRKYMDMPREQIKMDEQLNFLFYSRGPLWYRGFLMESSKYTRLEMPHFEVLLSYFKVRRIVVGHTTFKHVLALLGETVLTVDSGFKYGNGGEALLIKDGKILRATMSGEQLPLPISNREELEME